MPLIAINNVPYYVLFLKHINKHDESARCKRLRIYRFGTAGNTNVQGEEVKKLDVLANELFINMLSSSYTTALLVSEENSSVIEVKISTPA